MLRILKNDSGSRFPADYRNGESMSGADIKNLLGQLLAGLEDDNMLKKLDISKFLIVILKS